MVNTNNEILLSNKKKEIFPFATTWIELEGIKISEISCIKKDKYHMTSLIWKSKNKNKTKNQTYRNGEQTSGCQKGGCYGWVKRVKRNKTYKIPNSIGNIVNNIINCQYHNNYGDK